MRTKKSSAATPQSKRTQGSHDLRYINSDKLLDPRHRSLAESRGGNAGTSARLAVMHAQFESPIESLTSAGDDVVLPNVTGQAREAAEQRFVYGLLSRDNQPRV